MLLGDLTPILKSKTLAEDGIRIIEEHWVKICDLSQVASPFGCQVLLFGLANEKYNGKVGECLKKLVSDSHAHGERLAVPPHSWRCCHASCILVHDQC